MGQQTIYPGGSVEVLVPDGQKIALANYGGGIAQIYYKVGGGNVPPAWQFQQTLQNAAVTLGTFTGDQWVRVDANNSMVIYEVAVTPSTAPIDAATLGGLTASQFLRSDAADDADGIITFTAGATLENNIELTGEEVGGTGRTIAKVNASNEIDIGDVNVPTNIYSSGVISALASNVKVDNNAYFTGESSGGTEYVLIGVTGTDTLRIGATALPVNVISNGTVSVSAASVYLDNNYALVGEDTGAVGRTIAAVTSGDILNLGDTNIPTNLRSNGTVSIPAADVVIDNDKYYKSKESGGAIRGILGMLTTNVVLFGNLNNAAEIRSNGTVSVPTADMILSNARYYYSTDTGATTRPIMGVDGSDIVQIGATALAANIRSNGTVNVSAANTVLDNNRAYQMKEVGGTARAIMSINGSDVVQVGNGNLAVNIVTNGTLTYNGASLATGSIDTTAAQTITVVDGLITSIV